TVFNRSEDRLHELRAQVSGLAKDFRGALSFTPGAVPYGDLPPNLLVINVTALGLREEDPAPCSVADLPQGCKVYDSTYGCVNQLSRDCRARGIAYSDGLSMLVWQGARSFEMWTGHFPNTDTMTHAARTALSFRKSSQL
ncbi:hypothetical protein RZS08_14420, partial [Arthrospira platensis SPKY1]|nr:hypothetical protein [Arthrospira platensis SPKY1]